MGAMSRSAVSSGKSLGPGAVGPHLVPVFSCHAWGPSRPGKPHGALHPIAASGADGALLTLWKWREESRPGSALRSGAQTPSPHSPGHLSLLLLQGDPEVLGAQGGQWVPRIPLHHVPQGSPKRGNGVRPQGGGHSLHTREHALPLLPTTVPRRTAPNQMHYGWPCHPCRPGRSSVSLAHPFLVLHCPQGPQTHRRTRGASRTFISLQTASTL